MTIITAIYSCAGGVRSVVWNDCIQFAVYMAGAIATVWIIVTHLPGGWAQLVEFGQSTGRWQLFDFDPVADKAERHVLVGAVRRRVSIAGDARRRSNDRAALLVRKRPASASWALGLSGFVVLAQFALFLLIGVALACFYSRQRAVQRSAERRQGVHDVRRRSHGHRLPKGLILAAVLAATMSNLSASFNSSASSLMSDWLGRWLPTMDDRKSLRMARLLTLASAVVHAARGDRGLRNRLAEVGCRRGA